MALDGYRIVTALFRGRSPSGRAIFVAKPASSKSKAPIGRESDASIPRSLLHGADDRKAEDWARNSLVTFRLRAWKAEELGLSGPDDDDG